MLLINAVYLFNLDKICESKFYRDDNSDFTNFKDYLEKIDIPLVKISAKTGENFSGIYKFFDKINKIIIDEEESVTNEIYNDNNNDDVS